MLRQRSRKGPLPPAQEHIDKLEKTVNDGDYYGAQQMYKSISARYASAERYYEALDILESGACIQLEKGQVTCGAELAILFVETLVKGKFPYDDNTLDRVRKIYKNFPQISVPQQLEDDDDMQKLSEALGAAKTRVEVCSSFLKAAMKWSAEFGSHRQGSPEIHDMLAEYLYSESPELDMSRISLHFVRGNNPEKFASTLVNFMGKCYPGEDDLAIARAVLMYLSLGNLRDANYLMDEVKKQVESKELDYPESDLTEFIDYLLLTEVEIHPEKTSYFLLSSLLKYLPWDELNKESNKRSTPCLKQNRNLGQRLHQISMSIVLSYSPKIGLLLNLPQLEGWKDLQVWPTSGLLTRLESWQPQLLDPLQHV